MHQIQRSVFTAILTLALAYAAGIGTFALAYLYPTDYAPPRSEYFAVPLMVALRHPVVTALFLLLLYALLRMLDYKLRGKRLTVW